MFGKKAKELAAQLDRVNRENEDLKKKVASLEEELNRLRDQEASVSRAITEAGKAAARIEEDANDKRGKLLAEAEEKVRIAGIDAQDIRQRAESDADSVRKDADEYAQSVRKDADDYSDNTRTDVNIYVERTIMASQLEVRKRKEVIAELNDMLRKTTAYLTEQNDTFIAMLNSVIDGNETDTEKVCREVEKCSCSCKDCSNPCSEYSEEKGEETACDDAQSAVVSGSEENPVPCDEDQDGPDDLPEEYDSPAQLMQNIYHILKRDIPEHGLAEAPSEPVQTESSNIETVPETKPVENIESELPHDDTLMELVSDVVGS